MTTVRVAANEFLRGIECYRDNRHRLHKRSRNLARKPRPTREVRELPAFSWPAHCTSGANSGQWHAGKYPNALTLPTWPTRVRPRCELGLTEVAPGTEGTIHFKLDTANLAGKFQGAIVVFLNDPALPQAPLAFEGTIVPAVELSPRPAFYVAGLRGRGGQAAIEIVNHESEPLPIERIENPTERFGFPGKSQHRCPGPSIEIGAGSQGRPLPGHGKLDREGIEGRSDQWFHYYRNQRYPISKTYGACIGMDS